MVKFGLFWSLKVAGTENREISKMDHGNSHRTVRPDFYVSSRITEFFVNNPCDQWWSWISPILTRSDLRCFLSCMNICINQFLKKKDFCKYIKKEENIELCRRPSMSLANDFLRSLAVKPEVLILLGDSDRNVVSIPCQINFFHPSQRPQKINKYREITR